MGDIAGADTKVSVVLTRNGWLKVGSVSGTAAVEYKSRAAGWAPPDVQGIERLGATRMRQYVRAWINEWDLIRLDPDYRPATQVLDVASDYREQAGLQGPDAD